MINFPISCSLGHVAVVLKDDAELVSHHSSEHASTSLADYRKTVEGQVDAPPDPTGATIKQKAHATALAKYGLTADSLRAVKSSEVHSGSMITISMSNDILKALGRRDNISVNAHRFYLELFRFVLMHAATNDVKNLGGLDLHSTTSADKVWMSWDTVKDIATLTLQAYDIKFTFRRWQMSLDDLFWELWSDNEITALDDIRTNGTPRSRQFFTPDGNCVAPYVCVPDMFNNYLSPSERTARRLYNASAGVNKEGNESYEYVGLGNADAVDDMLLYEGKRASSMRNNKLWAGAGGSSRAPRTRPSMIATLHCCPFVLWSSLILSFRPRPVNTQSQSLPPSASCLARGFPTHPTSIFSAMRLRTLAPLL